MSITNQLTQLQINYPNSKYFLHTTNASYFLFKRPGGTRRRIQVSGNTTAIIYVQHFVRATLTLQHVVGT